MITDDGNTAPPPWLASIPGYGGYAAKEQRRLADRALRDELARRLSLHGRALQRLSAELAGARRYDDLASIDRATKRLQYGVDRLSSMPEGYRGLFEADRIDEDVLDQVMAFDAGLAWSVDRIGALVAALATKDRGTALDEVVLHDLATMLDRLHDQLDARATVFHSGLALAPGEALAVLEDNTFQKPALTMKVGDAASIEGIDYIVDAVVTYSSERSWSEYRLRDGTSEQWLIVQPDHVSLVTAIAAQEVAVDQPDRVTYDGRQFGLRIQGEATATILGPGGTRRGIPVAVADYRDTADGVVVIRNWDEERNTYKGRAIDPALIAIYPRA